MPSPVEFAEVLDLMGVPLFRLVPRPGGRFKDRYNIPKGWPEAKAANNERILGQIERFERSGAGAVCGHTFDVVDVDPRNGGLESFERLNAEGCLPRPCWVVQTGSGGWHFYVWSLGLRKAQAVLPGVDYQGAGSFVAIPPTEGYRVLPEDAWPDLETGTPARLRALVSARHSADAPEPDGPAWDGRPANARERLYLRQRIANARQTVRTAQPGERNATLNAVTYSLARLAAGSPLDPDEVVGVMAEAAGACGLDPEEITKTIDSAMQAGRLHPRAVPDPRADFLDDSEGDER